MATHRVSKSGNDSNRAIEANAEAKGNQRPDAYSQDDNHGDKNERYEGGGAACVQLATSIGGRKCKDVLHIFMGFSLFHIAKLAPIRATIMPIVSNFC